MSSRADCFDTSLMVRNSPCCCTMAAKERMSALSSNYCGGMASFSKDCTCCLSCNHCRKTNYCQWSRSNFT